MPHYLRGQLIETDIKQTANNVENAVKEKQKLIDTTEAEIHLGNDTIKDNTDEESISEEILSVDLPESPNTEVKNSSNTTIEIADYKMASGGDDQPTPLSFFRNIKQQEKWAILGSQLLYPLLELVD